MKNKGHRFACSVCGLLCSKGEFGYLEIMNPFEHSSQRLYLCKKHLAEILKIPADQQWAYYLELKHDHYHEERELLSEDGNESDLENELKCFNCGVKVLGTNQYTVNGRNGLEYRNLCEKCFRIRKAKQKLYYQHSFCGFCPETF